MGSMVVAYFSLTRHVRKVYKEVNVHSKHGDWMKMVLNIINAPWVVRFFKKSGRLAFRPSSENPPKDKIYLELRRIKKILLLCPKKPINMRPNTVLVEYETNNVEYYKQFTVDVSEIEKMIKEGKIEPIPLKKLNIITEWDADEAVAGYEINLETGEVKYWDVTDPFDFI